MLVDLDLWQDARLELERRLGRRDTCIYAARIVAIAGEELGFQSAVAAVNLALRPNQETRWKSILATGKLIHETWEGHAVAVVDGVLIDLTIDQLFRTSVAPALSVRIAGNTETAINRLIGKVHLDHPIGWEAAYMRVPEAEKALSDAPDWARAATSLASQIVRARVAAAISEGATSGWVLRGTDA